MKRQTELLVRSLAKDRKNRRRRLAVMTALAVLTGGSVYWELREIGTALTDGQVCTIEAHGHSEGCYDENGELVCGYEEHIHTAGCIPDEQADTETPDIWELSLPAENAATRQEQAALIAESQLGYAESSRNFAAGEDGEIHGYTRYGGWYGSPYGEWNTMFTYFCIYYAGVTPEEIPCGGNARTWQIRLEENQLLHPPDTVPERGSIILLDTDSDGEADRTGIVTATEEELTVVEGDADNTVAEVHYAADDAQILGYVVIPEPDILPVAKTAEADAANEPETILYSAESPAGIRVCASAEAGTFPEDTAMKVRDVPREEAVQTAAENLEADAEALDVVAVDIAFFDADGTEVEPAGDKAVQVQIILPEELRLQDGAYALLHVDDSGEVQEVEEAEVSGTGAEFAAESFSIYIVTSDGNKTLDEAMLINGQSIPNSEENPYILEYDEVIRVRYEGADAGNCSFTVEGNNFTEGGIEYHYINRELYDQVINGGLEAAWEGAHEGKCRIVRKQNNMVLEGFWVKVEDNRIYMMKNNERLLLDDATGNDSRTIYANVNDTFILSVNGQKAHKIGFKDWDSIATEYDMPGGYLHRGKPTYNNGNTFVEFTCLKDGVTEITANEQTIRVVIGQLAYMKMHDGRRLLLDDALTELNNSTTPTIYAIEGETLYFSVDGYRFDRITITSGADVLSKPTDASLSSLYENDNTVVPVYCEKEGTGVVRVGNRDVTIVVHHPLYVRTAIMDRDIDRVDEWLPETYAPKISGYIANRFICNNEWDVTHNNANPQGRLFPYFLYVDDEFEIYTTNDHFTNTPSYTIEYLNVTVEFSGTWGENSWYDRYTLTGTNAPAILAEMLPTETDAGTTAKRYRATGTGYVRITLKDGNQEVRTMYVRVLPKSSKLLDHADIEISDGGTYTLTKITRHANGTIEKVITQYDAYVDEINQSILYQKNGTPCTFYKEENGEVIVLEGVTGYVRENYWKDANIQPGDPQYEYTSKYKKDANGNYTYWSNIKYHAGDVESAVFDTNLKLVPNKTRTICYNADGTLASETSFTDVSDKTPLYRNNIRFTMYHQDVLDAYNKCPNHTGLDFTIMAFSALVEFDVSKELTGGAVIDGQFEFEILQKETAIVRNGYASANGTVNKSDFSEWTNNGLSLKGAYRIFYYDGAYHWGEGIDSSAALKELRTLPEFSNVNLNSTADIFSIANDDTNPLQSKLLRVLQQYLTVPAEYTSSDTQYAVAEEGLFLLSFESQPIQTVRNNADGLVTFNALHFEYAGTYHYIIREAIPANTADILYDRKELDLSIEVKKDAATNQLTADIESDISVLKFTNHTTYRLPDTGGTGALPYMLGGTSLIAGAAFLHWRKRKEAR